MFLCQSVNVWKWLVLFVWETTCCSELNTHRTESRAPRQHPTRKHFGEPESQKSSPDTWHVFPSPAAEEAERMKLHIKASNYPSVENAPPTLTCGISPVIPTFDRDPRIFTSRTCLPVNLAVMRVTRQHFRGSPSSQLICAGLNRYSDAGSSDQRVKEGKGSIAQRRDVRISAGMPRRGGAESCFQQRRGKAPSEVKSKDVKTVTVCQIKSHSLPLGFLPIVQ